jgi:hypothetical protein
MIEHYEFGEFIVDGREYRSNIVLLGAEVKEGRYLPGHQLKLDDFLPLAAYKPDVIIIGTGAYGAVPVPKEIIDYIEKRKIKLVIERTGKACATYNSLIKEGKRVAAFLHDTC